MEFVNGKGDIQKKKWNIKFTFQTTNQDKILCPKTWILSMGQVVLLQALSFNSRKSTISSQPPVSNGDVVMQG